jgi:hypothetical protein
LPLLFWRYGIRCCHQQKINERWGGIGGYSDALNVVVSLEVADEAGKYISTKNKEVGG